MADRRRVFYIHRAGSSPHSKGMTRGRTALMALGGAAAFAAFAALAAFAFLDWRAETQSQVFERQASSCAQGDTKACEVLQRGCANDSGPACLALADNALEHGPRYEALRLLDKACDLNMPLGCLRAGRVRLNSPNMPENRQEARQALERGCALGSEEACRLARELEEAG